MLKSLTEAMESKAVMAEVRKIFGPSIETLVPRLMVYTQKVAQVAEEEPRSLSKRLAKTPMELESKAGIKAAAISPRCNKSLPTRPWLSPSTILALH